MSSSSPPKEKDLDILPELPLHHDQSKSDKRESLAPQSLPARNSSLQSSRQQGNTSETVPVPISKDNKSQNDDEKPPTPPPKPQRRRQRSAPKEGTVEPVKQNKAGLFARIMIALATCCQPSTAGVESRPRRVKEPLEMETMRKDLPTTSKPNEKDSEAAKLRVMEDTRPSVTIAPDAQTQKEPNGQARIVTPALYLCITRTKMMKLKERYPQMKKRKIGNGHYARVFRFRRPFHLRKMNYNRVRRSS